MARRMLCQAVMATRLCPACVTAALVVGLTAACAGPVKPAVLRNMTTLPADPVKEQEQTASANAVPDADRKKPLPPKLQQVETFAAGAAAFIGTIFSSSPNVLLGAGAPVDEMLLIDPNHAKRKTPARGEEQDDGGAGAGEGAAQPADELVPWIRFSPSK